MFPEENHNSKFIKTHVGMKNATTGEEYTNFHFDVKKSFKQGVGHLQSNFQRTSVH